MNKIDNSSFFCPQLLLFDVCMTKNLRSGWGDGLTLTGHFWRLYYNTKSGAGVYINGNMVEIRPDRLYLLAPNCELKTFCEAADIGQLYIHFVVPQYSGSRQHLFYELPLEDVNQIMLKKIMSKIQLINSSPEVNLLAVAFTALCLSQLPKEALNERGVDQRIFQTCLRIHTYPDREFSLGTMAQQAGMNSKTFLRAFRDATGTTPYQYVQNIRYTIAARLLRTTVVSIKEICEQVGLNDRFHFSRQFKLMYGMPPAAYRRKFLTQQFPGSALYKNE